MIDLLKMSLVRKASAAEFTAQALEIFLNNFQDGEHVDLYGCGSFGHALIKKDGNPLSRLKIRFIQTNPGEMTTFHEYTVVSPEEATIKPATAVLLLSDLYDSPMRACLKHYSGKIIGLKQAMDTIDFAPLLKKIEATIKEHTTSLYNETIIAAEKRPIVAFVTDRPALHTFKIMKEIRSQGYAVLLCVEHDSITKTIHVDDYIGKGYFDTVFKSKTLYPIELIKLLLLVNPKIVHAEAGMWEPYALAIAMEKITSPVVVDYRDVQEIVFTDANQACEYMKVQPSVYAIEERAREDIFKRAAGIIYKESDEVVDFLQKKYNHRPKHLLQYFPYIVGNNISDEILKTEKRGIVYAGNITYDPEWHAYPLYAGLLKAAKTIADQGIHFTIFNSLDSTGDGFEDFVNLSKENPYFHYKFALPYQELMKELPYYEYAFFCFDYANEAVENPFFTRVGLGSKVFTYLDAGLPVIVSKEIEFMAEILKKMNLAIPYSYPDLPHLKKHLQTIDRKSLLKNITQVRDDWSHKKNRHKLKDLYENIITGK